MCVKIRIKFFLSQPCHALISLQKEGNYVEPNLNNPFNFLVCPMSKVQTRFWVKIFEFFALNEGAGEAHENQNFDFRTIISVNLEVPSQTTVYFG